MNIFHLHKYPILAAQYHCDKHVVKMTLETAQLLSIAHRVLDKDECRNTDLLYKVTHVNHPLNIWVRESVENYAWTVTLFDALAAEYTFRYGKVHKSFEKLEEALITFPKNISYQKRTPIPLCMPDEFKCDDPIEAYRKFYMSKQDKFKMVWTKREVPDWFKIESEVS